MSVLLLSFFACVVSAPLPDVGPCADYPDGVYEYGQIGIGTCLAGPASLQFLDDGHVLAVSTPLHTPLLQPTGGQSNGQMLLDSPAAQVRSPQIFAAAGQSLGQVAVLSPDSHVPLPQTGPPATHLNAELQVWLPLQTPQLPLHAGTLPHL